MARDQGSDEGDRLAKQIIQLYSSFESGVGEIFPFTSTEFEKVFNILKISGINYEIDRKLFHLLLSFKNNSGSSVLNSSVSLENLNFILANLNTYFQNCKEKLRNYDSKVDFDSFFVSFTSSRSVLNLSELIIQRLNYFYLLEIKDVVFNADYSRYYGINTSIKQLDEKLDLGDKLTKRELSVVVQILKNLVRVYKTELNLLLINGVSDLKELPFQSLLSSKYPNKSPKFQPLTSYFSGDIQKSMVTIYNHGNTGLDLIVERYGLDKEKITIDSVPRGALVNTLKRDIDSFKEKIWSKLDENF